MKQFFVLFSALLLSVTSYCTVYYSQGSLPANTLTSWNTVRTGGGTVPASFTIAGDVFIIQNAHSMTTNAVWTLGGAGSVLRIETGGSLLASNEVILTGQFELQDNATYIHGNPAAPSIFNATLVFASQSTVEIRNWDDVSVSLPVTAEWGNLVFNYAQNIGGDWDLAGSLSTVKGNLVISATGVSSHTLILNPVNSQVLSVGGSLQVNGGHLLLNAENDTSMVQVEQDIVVTGGELNLGAGGSFGANELRFKGNLEFTGGTITHDPSLIFALLVANGTSLQEFSSSVSMDVSLKIAPGANLQAMTNLNFTPANYIVVSGTFNTGIHTVSLAEGSLSVAGGTMTSNGTIGLTNATVKVCTGDGTNDGGEWCVPLGTRGVFNVNGSLDFSTSGASQLFVGLTGSPGNLLATNAMISFAGDPGSFPVGLGSVEMNAGGILSLDPGSFVTGEAYYQSSGGKLVIGSSEGIELTEAMGNIQVTGARNYDFAGSNSFEYKGNSVQQSGNGLPDIIDGDLIINNSGGKVVLNKGVSIATGYSLTMTNGKLETVGSNIVTLSDGATHSGSANSYVLGPLQRAGFTDFTYHVGSESVYAPASIYYLSNGAVSDAFRVEYVAGNPRSVYTGDIQANSGMVTISSVEFWKVDQLSGTSKNEIVLPWGPHSGVSDPSTLVGANYVDGYWGTFGRLSSTGGASSGSLRFTLPFGAPLTFGTTSAANALPIHLLSFNAKKLNQDRIIEWVIAEGKEAAYFELLTSPDNRNFTVMEKIMANPAQVKYALTDTRNTSTTYYKLKMTGTDGMVSYSRVVILFGDMGGFVVTGAFPTATRSFTTVNISSSRDDKVELMLTNFQGQVVSRKQVPVREGNNPVRVDLGGISAGQYLVTVTNSRNERSSVRVVRN